MKTKVKLVRVARNPDDINGDYFLEAELAESLDKVWDGVATLPYDPESKYYHLRHTRKWGLTSCH